MSTIIFQALSEHHIQEGWLKWVQNHNPHGFTEFVRLPPNKETLLELIAKRSETELWLAACLVEEQNRHEEQEFKYFGNVHIYNISWIDRRCTFGRLIGDSKMRGRGIGTNLTVAILNYCFTTLNMHKVTAGCLSCNEAAIKSNLKAGMTEEAILKNDRYMGSSYVDTHLFAAWQESWNLD